MDASPQAAIHGKTRTSNGVGIGNVAHDLDPQRERSLRRWLSNWSRARRGVSTQDFEDIYQDAWCRLLERQHRGGEIRSYEGALLWGVHNSWLMEQRRRRRRPVASESAPWETLSAGDTADPVQQIESRETVRRVFEAIAIVPERQRQIVLLADVAGVPPAEIRTRLGISERTYHRDRASALQALGAHLGGLLGDVGGQRSNGDASRVPCAETQRRSQGTGSVIPETRAPHGLA